MSLTRATKLQVKSAENFGTGAYTPAAFTPSNNSLLVVCVRAQSESNDAFSGADLTITPSVGSATSRYNSTTSPGWSYGMRVWTIPITTGVSMTLQFDAGAFNVHQYHVSVYEEVGYNTSTPVGATASGTDADGDNAATLTLSGAPATDSEVFGFACVSLNGPGTPGITNGSGFTELWDDFTSDWSINEDEVRTGSASTTVDWVDLSTSGGITAGAVLFAMEIKAAAGASPATLSAGTPSGTIGTQTTATIGATTDQNTGTLYVVVDTTANLSGVTAAQIKAGQKASGAAALAASNGAISTTSPSQGVTGLAANTAYGYRIIQNNANGDSNIITGTFTTASTVPAVTSVDGDNAVASNQTGVIVLGGNFGASQGTGKVYLCPSDNVADAGKVEQTVTAWGDTSITISIVKGSLSLDTNLFLFVTSNAGTSNAAGRTIQIVARVTITETLIGLTGAAVASVSGITMLVWRALPTTIAPNPSEALTVATNGSGQVSQQITRGSLVINDPVWIAFLKDGSPAKASMRKVTPVYS